MNRRVQLPEWVMLLALQDFLRQRMRADLRRLKAQAAAYRALILLAETDAGKCQ